MLSFNKYMLFSKKEIIIVFMLIISFLTGSGIKLYKNLYVKNESNLYYEQQLTTFEKEINSVIVNKIARNNVNLEIIKIENKLLSIDINRATKEEFEKLPYIGPVLAQRIIDYRQQMGKFKKAEELINIKGIGVKKFNKFKQYIKVK